MTLVPAPAGTVPAVVLERRAADQDPVEVYLARLGATCEPRTTGLVLVCTLLDSACGSPHPTSADPGSPNLGKPGIPTDGYPVRTARGAVDNRLPTDGEARSGHIPTAGDPTVLEEQIQELSPPTPRPAGGPALVNGQTFARRAFGANHRADADRVEADRRAEESARRQAHLEAETASRRAADVAARTATERLEAEALAVSAALDDGLLQAIVELVSATLPGLLARSPLAVTRAVIAWCRTATAADPGPLAAAVDSARRQPPPGDGCEAPPLTLPAPPCGTEPLRDRIADLLRRHDQEVPLTATGGTL